MKAEKYEILRRWNEFIDRVDTGDDILALFEEWQDGQEAVSALQALLTLVEDAMRDNKTNLKVADVAAILEGVTVDTTTPHLDAIYNGEIPAAVAASEYEGDDPDV